MDRRVRLAAAMAVACGFAPSAVGAEPVSLRDLAAKVQPSVVEILGPIEQSGETSYGTGFVFGEPGIVVTNAHVVRGVRHVQVRTIDGALLASVQVIDVRDDLDLAVLRVIGLNAPPLQASRGGPPAVGTEVIAVGHPRGYEFTVSNGIVSALRSLREGGIAMIQTTAPISPGSSGGPLVDRAGGVVGVCSLTLAEGQNINFAVPASHLTPVVDAAIELERGLLGDGDELSAEAMAQRVRQRREEGDLVRADELAGQAIDRHPTSLPLLAEAAEVAWSRGRFGEVEALVERMHSLDSSYAPGRQIRASLLAQKGQCELAVTEAEASIAQGLDADQAAEAHAVLAECLGRLGRPGAALEHVDRALKSPRVAAVPDYHAVRAFLLQAADRADEADRAAITALVLSEWDPLVVAALRERGLPRLVEIVSSKGSRDAEGGLTVRGVVRNRGPVPLEQIVITAEGRDASTELVATGTATVSPSRLVPGQTGSFQIGLDGAPDEVAEFFVRVVDYKEP